MRDLMLGGLLIVTWIVLQFVVQSTSGFIHLALGAGVVLLVRGIVVANPGPPR